LEETGGIVGVAGLWMLWCAMHSLLIATPVVSRAKTRLGRWFAWYRLGYVLLSTITLLPLFFWTLRLPSRLLFAWDGPWWGMQGALLLYALVMAVGGAREYDLSSFLGLRQITSQHRGEAQPEFAFATKGILRYVRHPWYSGGLALVWAAGPVTTVSLAVKLVLTGYLLLGAYLEERKLVAALGERYRDYQHQVPMLIPGRPRH
jgi:protein-S-isoprenylcysteine O-methyltransferase Ste14